MPADAARKMLFEAEAPPAIAFAKRKAFRTKVGHAGRVHVDRALPFLILHRRERPDPDSLARRVATTAPAYAIWSPGEDGAMPAMIAAVTARLGEAHDRVLLVSLYDLPRDETIDDEDPELERFVARISTSDDAAAQHAAKCLEAALTKIEVDLRTCKVEYVSKAWFEPGVEALVDRAPALSHLSVGLPQNYRVPGTDGIYPQLLHDLTVAIFDALLQGFREFLAQIAPDPPRSHRALGRSSFIAAARTVDRKLFDIASAFDFLLGVSPINSAQAFDRFKESKYEEAPAFRYRPLTVDPDVAKRALYAIELKRVEDPILETLFAEKRHEIDQQLTMLHGRNTSAFRYSSLMLYGAVDRPLLDAARDILDRVAPAEGAGKAMVDCHSVRDAACALIARYKDANAAFDADVSLREDIAPGMMVSGRKLFISTDTRMRRHRLDALLQHEVSIHVLTCVNGASQGLRIFQSGLAGYEGVQEGLGVFAEWSVGGLTPARLRLLAARVVVVDAMIEGAGFVECFRLLRRDHGFSVHGAFNIVARIFRSGGFAKDAIYLRGFKEVLDLVASGVDLAPFWLGKIAGRHLPVVEELSLRGLLRRPRSVPEFLHRPDARDRIAALRAAPSLSTLI